MEIIPKSNLSHPPQWAGRHWLLAALLAAIGCGALRAADLARATPSRVEPLRPAPVAAGGPLFTRISPEQSRLTVVNAYDDPDMWGRRYTEFANGPIGTGIAVGDYDGDGRPDIYIVTKTGPNRLYRQIAPLMFEDVTERAGVGGGKGWGAGATFADVDGDGRLDLYVCRLGAPNLYFRNNGDGTFTERAAAAGIAVTAGSVIGTFEDYDHDGRLDLFLLTNISDEGRAPEGDRDYLFHNNGDGAFTDVTAAAGLVIAPERGHSATWWDLDNDGWADLYIANDFDAPDHLYRNNGDGTSTDIAAGVLPHTPWYAMGSDFCDVNNDGAFDFFVADMSEPTHLGRQMFSVGRGESATAMDQLRPPQYTLNAFYLNQGSGRFLEAAQLLGIERTGWTWSVLFGDFDNDGWEDLHVTNGMVRHFANSDLLMRMRQVASPAQAALLMKRSPVLNEKHRAFRNNGRLRLEDVTARWGLADSGVAFGAVAADLDGDGDLDLIYSNFEQPPALYRNNSTANRIVVVLRGPGANRFSVGARVFATTAAGRMSRRVTLCRGVLSSAPAEVAFGLGSLPRIERLEIDWSDGLVQVADNLAANCRYTFIEPDVQRQTGLLLTAAAAPARPAMQPTHVDGRTAGPSSAPQFRDASGETALTFEARASRVDELKAQPLLPLRRASLGGGVAFGDANGDGRTDVYFAGAGGAPGRLYLNRGDGIFAANDREQPWSESGDHGGNIAIPTAAAFREMAPLWLDVNGDDAPDLLVTGTTVVSGASAASGLTRLYLNDGTGRFRPAPANVFPADAAPASATCAADFDHDGDLDVFIGGSFLPGQYPLSAGSRLLENRQGVFADVSAETFSGLEALGRVTAAVWSDVNDDGWPDLLVATEWGPVRLFMNHDGKRFEEGTAAAGFASRTGWWNAIEAADVNGDGAMDYIVANAGLNTPYHATEATPVRLYYGDFDESGRHQIVESYEEDGQQFPRRNYATLTRSMPVLRRLYPTFEAFGRGTLEEIFPLDGSVVLSASELASGVFLNDGHGHFTFHELPRIAQIAPGYGLAARDFDGDGNVDLLIVQNFRGTRPGLPHFDGGRGLLLRGRGDGTFAAVSAAASGIDIPEDGRGLAVADLNGDGWPDALAVRVNAVAVSLINRGPAPGRHSFEVKLTGASGNLAAIGAVVTVTRRDGTRQRVELSAGAGYLSQSEPLAFFGYRDGAEPVRLEIRWPDGRNEVRPWTPGVRLEFAEPARLR